MRNSSRIFIASAFSGFCPILGAKMWNLSQIFIGSGISGFCRISSVYSSGRGKNVIFEPNFHRECIFLILPNFGVQKCEIWAKFSSVVEFLDFAGFQVFACPGSARMRNSSRIFIASSFSGFCPILGAKMWNLTQIFIGSEISGLCRISSVYKLGRCKNAKFEPNFFRECIFWILPDFWGKNVKFVPNFHRQWNFWILPDFKCLQVREVQQGEIRAEFSSRVHFLDFAQILG